MKIGVISDTHGSLPTAVHTIFAGVEHIIHAGDIGGQSILDELATIAPITAVFGNCDYFGDYLNIEETAKVALDGTRLFVAHTPLLIEEALKGYGEIHVGEPLPHMCVHGHTHVPRNERLGGVQVLCPGSLTRPRGGSRPSVLILETSGGLLHEIEFVTLR